MERLKGKVAIVTGGAHGIGRAMSELFAEEECWGLVADVEQDAGRATVEHILSQGASAEFCHADVSKAGDATRAVARAAKQAGRIDVLCKNAAWLGALHDVMEASDDKWQRSVAVSLLGARNHTRGVLPNIISGKNGSIVNVVSIQAMIGCPASVAYSTVKTGLLGFTASVACDTGPKNIRVNALYPGPIQTRISPQRGEEAYQWQCAQTMLGRVGYPREVASAALLLASDEACYITGAGLPVEGGWTAK